MKRHFSRWWGWVSGARGRRLQELRRQRERRAAKKQLDELERQLLVLYDLYPEGDRERVRINNDLFYVRARRAMAGI